MTSQQPTIERVVAPGAPAPFGHYAPATVSPDGTIWVSAQLPVVGNDDRDCSAVSQQAHRALANVVTIVEAAGGTVASVVKVTLYLVDIDDWDAVDAAFADVFGAHRPARAVLQVAGLHHGFRVAVDAIAWRVGR
ncbi:MAG TPA: RidA family protein [Nocardioides sp.]|nr:RidA family protein [Nocardioides sp.]